MLFPAVLASCIVSDSQGNPYLFGSPQGHFQLTDFKPVKGPSLPSDTRCFLGQFNNAVYMVSPQQPIHAYFFANQSWAQIQHSGLDVTNADMILDHDTLVFYALSDGGMYFLPITGASTATWTFQRKGNFPQGSKPILGFSQNHIFFLNNPTLKPGQTQVFVIHYAYFQPEIQTFTGALWPQQPGKTAIVPVKDNSVPLLFAYVPNDFSGTYLANAEVTKNTTVLLAAPPIKDINAVYTATFDTLYQLTSDYQLWQLPLNGNKWTQTKNQVLTQLGASIQNTTAASATTQPTSIPKTETKSSAKSLEWGVYVFALALL
ncbi:hypothetical protein EDD86DRAFT_16504 [Gorgonomyces haynaldii]|nr:hypothetical protein EDD86DRAFT_16504 [Gorgonomyces haynaldii]